MYLWCGNISLIASGVWRVGLHPRALANAEGDSIQWELGLLAVRRGVAHRRAQGKGNKSSQGRGH